MTFDGLRVDHAGLAAASDDLRAGVLALRSRLDRLEADLGPLRSEWSGQAQQAYHQAKSRWDAALEGMTLLLDDTSRAVQQADADYRAADARGAAAFGA